MKFIEVALTCRNCNAISAHLHTYILHRYGRASELKIMGVHATIDAKLRIMASTMT